MLSLSNVKKIASLKSTRYRQKYGQFTVEGRKGVDELIHSNFKVEFILATKTYADRWGVPEQTHIVTDAEMKLISAFTTAPGILAVAEIRTFTMDALDPQAPITLVLDGISDPGNLGTLIRTADWFGIHQIVLSPDCTDFYNPKALSATMGSFARPTFVYTELSTFLKDKNTMGCLLDGADIAAVTPELPLYLVVGSESHGIRPELVKQMKHKVTIPGYGDAESLNAAVAAGIVMEKMARAAFSK
jgi:TrmH family RNA methyltransferase